MNGIENLELICVRCGGPWNRWRHVWKTGFFIPISGTAVCFVSSFHMCCHLFPIFVSSPLCSFMSSFFVCFMHSYHISSCQFCWCFNNGVVHIKLGHDCIIPSSFRITLVNVTTIGPTALFNCEQNKLGQFNTGFWSGVWYEFDLAFLVTMQTSEPVELGTWLLVQCGL